MADQDLAQGIADDDDVAPANSAEGSADTSADSTAEGSADTSKKSKKRRKGPKQFANTLVGSSILSATVFLMLVMFVNKFGSQHYGFIVEKSAYVVDKGKLVQKDGSEAELKYYIAVEYYNGGTKYVETVPIKSLDGYDVGTKVTVTLNVSELDNVIDVQR